MRDAQGQLIGLPGIARDVTATRQHLRQSLDPFFTTKLGQGGSGLGLHIAYTLTTGLLGGRIDVQSAPGQGTVFMIELPRVAPATLSDQSEIQRLSPPVEPSPAGHSFG